MASRKPRNGVSGEMKSIEMALGEGGNMGGENRAGVAAYRMSAMAAKIIAVAASIGGIMAWRKWQPRKKISCSVLAKMWRRSSAAGVNEEANMRKRIENSWLAWRLL